MQSVYLGQLMKKKQKILAGFVVVMFLIMASLTGINLLINSSAQYTFDDIKELQPVYCAILLGTSKWLGEGRKNLYYQYRITAAIEVYQSGKCKKIIVSGDNSTLQYNEPMTMKRDLVKAGVKEENVICDYAGFRTLDSILRFKEIFGQNKGIVISQKFHNTRAVYIGRQYGIKLYGYNARDVTLHWGLKTRIREFFSKVMCFIDVYFFHTQPKYLGDTIII